MEAERSHLTWHGEVGRILLANLSAVGGPVKQLLHTLQLLLVKYGKLRYWMALFLCPLHYNRNLRLRWAAIFCFSSFTKSSYRIAMENIDALSSLMLVSQAPYCNMVSSCSDKAEWNITLWKQTGGEIVFPVHLLMHWQQKLASHRLNREAGDK